MAGPRSCNMLERLFRGDDITLEQTFEIAQAMEQAEAESRNILQDSNAKLSSAHTSHICYRTQVNTRKWSHFMSNSLTA